MVKLTIDHPEKEKDMAKAKFVSHHDDPPCQERLIGGYCPECQIIPDMQSTCLYCYCPSCDVPLENMACPVCGKKFEKP